MSVQYMDQHKKYDVLILPVDYTKSFLDLSIAEIRAYYEWFLKIKNDRLAHFCNFLFENSDNCLDEKKLNVVEIFMLNAVSVAPKPGDQFRKEAKQIPLHLRPFAKPDDYVLDTRTISICFDVGIYLGELIIQIDPKICWMLEEDDEYSDYGQPVIGKNKEKLRINPFRVAKNAAARIHEERFEDGQLSGFFNAWKKGFKV